MSNIKYDSRKPLSLKILCMVLAAANARAAIGGRSCPVAAKVLERMEAQKEGV